MANGTKTVKENYPNGKPKEVVTQNADGSKTVLEYDSKNILKTKMEVSKNGTTIVTEYAEDGHIVSRTGGGSESAYREIRDAFRKQ